MNSTFQHTTFHTISLFPMCMICLIPVTSCVPHYEIEGLACPCPTGYHCCETLGGCIPQSDECPLTYPPSSKTPCLYDRECPRQEVCISWQMQNQTYGAKRCHTQCTPEHACSNGESCTITATNACSIDSLQARQACLPANPDCPQEMSCSLQQLGETFCKEHSLYGCFVSLHQQCGLLCRDHIITPCDSCIEGAQGARCTTNQLGDTDEQGDFDVDSGDEDGQDDDIVDGGDMYDGDNDVYDDLCTQFSCNACPATQTTFCHNDHIAVCSRVTVQEQHCSHLCMPIIVESCTAGCSATESGAACD